MSHPFANIPYSDHALYFPGETFGGLKTMLVNAGHAVATDPAKYRWDGLKRGGGALFIWQYTLKGRGCVCFENIEYDLLPGDAFLLNVPEYNCYRLPADSESWEFVYVTLAGTEAIRLANEARKRLGIVVQHDAHSDVVNVAKSILTGLQKNELRTRYEAGLAAYRFVMALLAEAERNGKNINDTVVDKAEKYLLAHIADPVTVDDLAYAAGLSRSHFTRCFSSAARQTPHTFILETKMGLAVRLLQTTTLSVKEISSRCGYDDPSYFCKCFKSVHNVTPKLFRKSQ